MPIQVLPQVRSTGQQAGENFSGGISNALGMLTQHKMNQLHQRSQWQQKQKELEYTANLAQQQKQFAHNLEQEKIQRIAASLEPKVGKDMSLILASNPKALAAYAEQQNFGIEGLNTLQGMNAANQPQEQELQELYQEPARGPMSQQEAYQQALSGNALNPNQAVSDVNQQRRAAHVAAKAQKPKGPTRESNHSAWVLTNIQEPRGKLQEKMVERAEKEQDRLEKQYGKKIEEYSKHSQQNQAAEEIYRKQVDLINSGNMPNPKNQAFRDLVKHGGLRTVGTALGAAAGGPIGALIGGGLTGGLDLSSFAGEEGNELNALNTQLYKGAGEIFPRLTETEFGKYELGLPQLTDTDEVKIKKINALLFKDQREKIIYQKIEEIQEENGGFLIRNIVPEAEKRAKKDLDKLAKQYHSGKFGYKYEPKNQPKKAIGHTLLG